MVSGDDEDRSSSESLTPEETFAIIGNEIRADILRVLSQTRVGEGSLPALSFSELRSRIGPDAESSRFNYHLQQLVGRFVERTRDGSGQLDDRMAGDVGDGYVLRPEGTVLTRTVRANIAAGHRSPQPIDIDLDCYFCETPVDATYGNALFMAQCPECEYIYEYELTPPGALDDGHALVDRISAYLRHRRLAFARGSCPLCANGLKTTFVAPDQMEYPRADRREALVNRWCDHCGERDYLRIGEVLLREPALITFCNEHGRDVTRGPLWKLEFVATDRPVTVPSTDPWEVSFQLTRDGDTLELVLNEDLELVENVRS